MSWYSDPMTYRSRWWWWTLMRRTVLGPTFAISHTLIWISLIYVGLVLQVYGVSLGRDLESEM